MMPIKMTYSLRFPRCFPLLLAAGAAVFSALPASAQTTNAIRPVTVQECFEMALRENLDLQIQRINPSLARLDLEIARAGYDPRFNFSGAHSYNASAGGRDPNNIPFPGSTTESDSFRSSISGQGPYGFGYTLNGNINDTYGQQSVRIGTNLFGLEPFENAAGSIGITMSQPLLRNFLFDPIRYDIAVRKNLLKGSELDLRNQIISVINEVEKSYNELIYSRENVKVQEEGLRLARQLLADNKRRVQIGILSPLEEKQSESEAYARQADLSSALRSLATAQNNLKRLITSNYQNIHDVTLQPSEALIAVPQRVDVFESWNAGLAKRPDILQARRAVELQGITIKYTRNQRLPQLDVTGTYGYGGSGADEMSGVFANVTTRDQPFWSIGTVASIPLSNKAARENYKRARLTSDQLVLTLKKQEQDAMVEIDEAVNAARTALDRIESTRQARVYAEQALDGGQKRLQAGTATSFEVLQLQRDLIDARNTEIRATADYNNALSDLQRAEGTTLEQKKIDLHVR
jgi:outer membrane protein TolC